MIGGFRGVRTCGVKGEPKGEVLFSLWFYKTKDRGQRVTSSRLPPAAMLFLPKNRILIEVVMALF